MGRARVLVQGSWTIGSDRNRVAYCETTAIAHTPSNRTSMFQPRVRFRILIPVLVLGLLLGGCIMPTRQDEVPTQPPAEPPVDEPAPEMPEEVRTAIVGQDANVRTGPSTDHAIAYWLTAGAEVKIVGRNEDGTWLQIEHQDRPGWIFTALTDLATETAAQLPTDAPSSEPEPVVAEPTPEAVEPAPEPTSEPEAATPDRVVATVTGTVVNLRAGPGTEHATDGQVRAGDQLHVTGRNADGSWLQVEHPAATGELVWIYSPLTDIDGVIVAELTVAGQVEVAVEIETPPTPEPAAPTPEPVAQPTPEPTTSAIQAPVLPDGCTRIHTVNPNETQLSQITDWFGLDLQAVANLNGIEPDAPLTAGWQICLPEAGAAPPAAVEPATTPAPVPESPIAPPANCPACPALPDFPEHGHPNALLGQKVVDSPLDVLWHAPGTYPRDLPGLDYDFELVLTDHSIMWNWSVRDFEACYDAVRVHMDEASKEVGLTRLEIQLHDPTGSLGTGWHWGYRDYATGYQSPWTSRLRKNAAG